MHAVSGLHFEGESCTVARYGVARYAEAMKECHERVCDEDGSAKAGALLDTNVAQSFAHHAHVFECCNIPCQSVSVQVPYHTSAFVIPHAATWGCPPKMNTLANTPSVPSQGCLKLLCRCIALHMWMTGPTGLEPAFPFRDVEQVPCAFSGDPLEDDRCLDSCATCGRSCNPSHFE